MELIWTTTDFSFCKYGTVNVLILIRKFEVEQIARMKPKARNENETGLLEYLEDIIGTDKYLTPIKEAEKLVEQLTEERASKLQRVKLIQKDKEGLEQTKNEAEAYLNTEKEIIEKYKRCLTRILTLFQRIYPESDRTQARQRPKERDRDQSRRARTRVKRPQGGDAKVLRRSKDYRRKLRT